MKSSFLAVFMVVAACSAGAPATPSPVPPTLAPTGAPTVAPTASPTAPASATPGATATSDPESCDPYYNPCHLPSATPGASATPAASVSTVSLSSDGTYLVGPNAMTLYEFDSDSPGHSACTSSDCSGAWPALTVDAGATPTAGSGVTGTLATFDRGGGVMQVEYNDQPLYYFIGDSKPGDTAGTSVAGWHLAKP